MRRILVKSGLGLAVLALAASAVAWGWLSRNGHKLQFTTAKVTCGDLLATISATGTIEPVEVVDVGAQVAGLIQEFGKDSKSETIDYGSMVDEGTVLARIDDSVYAADLALAKAQVEQNKAGELRAAADLEQLRSRASQTAADWARAQELSRSKLIPSSDYDSYRASFEIARANVSVGEAALAQARAATMQSAAQLSKAQRNLDFCVIKSPVKGVIIDRRVNIGQTVVASLNAPSLFLIAKDLTHMQVWVGVNEADVGRIPPGAPVTFTCDAFPSREFTGSVGKVRLNATMTQNVVMYTVEVNTDNRDNVLLPYLTANVRFVARKETGVLLVPNAALRWSPSSLAQVAPESRSWRPSNAEQTDPPSAAQQSSSTSASVRVGAEGRVGVLWLTDGKFVRPLEVKVSTSDGTSTAVISDALRPGQEVVTGEILEAQAGTQNPFLPQFRRR